MWCFHTVDRLAKIAQKMAQTNKLKFLDLDEAHLPKSQNQLIPTLCWQVTVYYVLFVVMILINLKTTSCKYV